MPSTYGRLGPDEKTLPNAIPLMAFRPAPPVHGDGLSLRSNAIWYLGGTAVYAASQWLIVIVFARLAGPSVVGLFTMATAISAPIIALSQLSLRYVMVTDVSGRYAFGHHLDLRLMLTGVAILAVFCVILLLGYRGYDALALALFGLGRAFESVSDIYYGRLQSRRRLDRVAQLLILRAALTLAATSATFWQTHSLVWSGLLFACASLASQFIVQITVPGEPIESKRSRGRWRRLYMTSLVRHAAPLATAQFLVALSAFAPRFVLNRIGGTSMVGQFAAIDYFLSIGLLFVAALGQSASPTLARAFHASDMREFHRVSLRIVCETLAVGAGGLVLTILFGRAVLIAFYGRAFGETANAFTPIVAGGMVLYLASILGYVVTATGQFAGLVWRYAIALAVTVIVAIYAGSVFGIAGMGAALAAGGGTSAILALSFLRKISAAKLALHVSATEPP